MTNRIFFRLADPSDLQEMQELFMQTITEVCNNDYNKDQIGAWISGVSNTQRWLDRFKEQYVLLAIIADQIAGFGTIKDANYIDMLFIHKDFQGQGIARSIYTQLEVIAKDLKSDQITADVSITARPFFEKMGFTVIEEQKVIRMKVELVNYKMRKKL